MSFWAEASQRPQSRMLCQSTARSTGCAQHAQSILDLGPVDCAINRVVARFDIARPVDCQLWAQNWAQSSALADRPPGRPTATVKRLYRWRSTVSEL